MIGTSDRPGFTGTLFQNNMPQYAGTGQSLYIWGADLRVTNDALNMPAYQRVGAATDYDTAGFLPYLAASTDDGMQTADITPGTDKVQVFAGVRKLSDAAQGVLIEFGASISGNDGTFLLAAPDGATATYGFDSKGTAQVDAVATTLAAPRTNVVTGLGDIAGDSCIIRVNGTQADADTGDQGTGNYLTGKLNLFARNGAASLWADIRFYGAVVRFGPNLSASEIAATEAYINARTGAY